MQGQLDEHGKTIQAIPLDMIEVGENIRHSYDPQKLDLLARSLNLDGLIQFPSLCMRKQGGGVRFVCRNGHRRILAAKALGWQTIECVIIPFESARDELYHIINANLKEDVFYLDLAMAYQEAAALGEDDKAIAERVGLNPRTVAWYRRLTQMNSRCQDLCRKYAEIFTATWAIKLARQGDLPKGPQLEKMMLEMVKEGKAWLRARDGSDRGGAQTVSPAKRRQASQNIRKMFSGRGGANQAAFAKSLLEQLREGGYISSNAMNKIDREFFNENQSPLIKKGLQSRSGASRQA